MMRRWFENHHTPYFFGWVWAVVAVVAFLVGAAVGVSMSFGLLEVRGLM